MKKKNKPYLLLELLIAFTLLALCAIPLVRNPLYVLQTEMLTFEKNELERLAELTFASIKAELFQNNISWEDLDQKKLPQQPFRKELVHIAFKGVTQRGYNRSIYIWAPYRKVADNKEEHRVINVKIAFEPVGRAKTETRAYNFQALTTRLSLNSEKKG
jgi:hypothetical protein